MNRTKPYKRAQIYLLGTALTTCFALLVWSFFIEPSSLVVREYRLNIPNWPAALDGTKIAIITDLHVGSMYVDLAKVKDVVAQTNKIEPDLTVLLGDYVANQQSYCPIKPSQFAPELGKLRAKNGVFAILGNHDWWYNGNEILTAFQRAHINVLENASEQVEINGHRIWIVGLADLWTRRVEINKAMEAIPLSEPIIVLSHNPDVFPRISNRVSLTLAGHTHGGQVAIPGWGPLVLPSQYGLRYARGHIVEDGKHLFVSTGIGTTALPVRLCTPPEISLLILSH